MIRQLKSGTFNIFQLDATAYPGNSGSPVFDVASGEVIGVINMVFIKGSKEAEHTNIAAIALIKKVLKANDIHPDCVTLLPSERESVADLFTATKYIDVIIPRGSAGLIEYVRKNSLVPVIETGAGVCHVYVDADADLDKAKTLSKNVLSWLINITAPEYVSINSSNHKIASISKWLVGSSNNKMCGF